MKTRDPQAQSPGNAFGRGSVSGPVLVLACAVSLGILTVGNAMVLDAVFGAFSPLWLAVMLLLEVALVAVMAVLRPRLRPTPRWNGLEILGMTLVGAAFLAHAVHLAPSDLMPVSFSVDNSHQHLLVNYVYQNDRFPDGVDYLYIYDDYPVAPSALAALSARLVGVLPAQTMYPLAVLLVTAQVMLAYGVSIELLPKRPASHVLAAVASLAVFFAYPYSVHVFAERFYGNMMMGDLIVLLTLWVVTVRDRLDPLFSAGVGLILVFGCLNSYPAWLPFVMAPLLASVVLERRLSIRQRLATAGTVLVIALALAAIAVADQWNFITWFAPVRDRRLIPGWESLGGLFLLLVGGGSVVLIRDWRRFSGFALFLAIDVGLVAALYGVALLDKLALYIPDKTFYFNIFVFAVLAALSLNWLQERLFVVGLGRFRQHRASSLDGGESLAGGDRLSRSGLLLRRAHSAALIMVVVCLLSVLVANRLYPSADAYPITLDEYRVAYQVAKEIPDAELTYLVRNGGTFYWIYGCVLNHTHDLTERSRRWQAERPTYESWIQDTEMPAQAMVSDLTDLPQDGQWHEVIRYGDSGVIEKIR